MFKVKSLHYWNFTIKKGVACCDMPGARYWRQTIFKSFVSCKRCLNTKVFKESLENHNEL